MTDLKAANTQLAKALEALDSNDHLSDVLEAEKIRNRLIDLDAKIGGRIQAKLDAHKAIADAWGKQEPDPVINRMAPLSDEPVVHSTVDTTLSDGWQKFHEHLVGRYELSGAEVPDPVLMNGVAEMPHSDVSRETLVEADEQ